MLRAWMQFDGIQTLATIGDYELVKGQITLTPMGQVLKPKRVNQPDIVIVEYAVAPESSHRPGRAPHITYITIHEASIQFDIKEDTLRRWCRTRKIEAKKVKNKWVIYRKSLEDWLSRKREKV